MMKIGSLIFTVLLALSSGAPLEGSCPDGSPNGALIERGRYIFECRSGNIVPKGCYTDDLKKIDVGQTADRKHYRLACTLTGNDLSFEPVACLHEGQEHKIDETFEAGTNFYTCKREGGELKVVNLGCLDAGKRVNLNDKIVKDSLVMLCNETVNNGARLMPTGCEHNGQQFNAGDSFEDGKQWYTCTRVGREKVVAKPAGCVAQGKRLNDGDRFLDNGFFYECMVDSGKIDVRVTACAQNDNGNVVERKLGCTWVEGQAPFQYEMQCKQEGNEAKKIFVRCNYKVGSGTYNIDAGCYRVLDKAAFGCVAEASGLKLQSFQGDNAESAAKGAGLHAC